MQLFSLNENIARFPDRMITPASYGVMVPRGNTDIFIIVYESMFCLPLLLSGQLFPHFVAALCVNKKLESERGKKKRETER